MGVKLERDLGFYNIFKPVESNDIWFTKIKEEKIDYKVAPYGQIYSFQTFTHKKKNKYFKQPYLIIQKDSFLKIEEELQKWNPPRRSFKIQMDFEEGLAEYSITSTGMYRTKDKFT